MLVAVPKKRVFTILLSNEAGTWEKYAYQGADATVANEAIIADEKRTLPAYIKWIRIDADKIDEWLLLQGVKELQPFSAIPDSIKRT